MHAPLPASGKLLTTARVLDTQDKGKAAVVVIHTVSRYLLFSVLDALAMLLVRQGAAGRHDENLCRSWCRCEQTGRIIAENEITSFNRGAGGFGKRPPVQRKPAAVARNTPPEWVLLLLYHALIYLNKSCVQAASMHACMHVSVLPDETPVSPPGTVTS